MRPGFGPARLRVRAPALPWPLFDRPRLAQPPPGRLGPRPGKGRPLAPAAGKEVRPRPPSPATCERGKVCGASAGRRGAARPWRSRSQPVTFWTSRQSGPRRARRRLRGGPESVRGRPRPGLRVSWLLGRDGFKLSGAPTFGEKAGGVPLILFGAGGESKCKCDCLRVADMPLAREPYRWEPFRSWGY